MKTPHLSAVEASNLLAQALQLVRSHYGVGLLGIKATCVGLVPTLVLIFWTNCSWLQRSRPRSYQKYRSRWATIA